MPYPGISPAKAAVVDRCVKKLLADPKFKPRAGRTKKQSAVAVCVASIKGDKKSKSFNKAVHFEHVVEPEAAGFLERTKNI